MKKDMKWFKKKLDDIEVNTPRLCSHDSIWMLDRVNELLNQLDESEALSQECIEQKSIDTHVDTINGDIQVTFKLDDLQNLLVPKQEKVEVPRFVADILEENTFADLPTAFEELFSANAGHYYGEDVCKWIVSNDETFARAWLDDFTVEEEKYYAKLKEIKPPEKEWLTNLSGPNYYAIDAKGLMLGEFILDLVGMKTEASTHTLKDWGRHGINDSNADFVKVEELEE